MNRKSDIASTECVVCVIVKLNFKQTVHLCIDVLYYQYVMVG